jgi:hypothetical protein
MATTASRYTEVDAMLANLAQDRNIPAWLIRALRIANMELEVLLMPSRPAEVAQFLYPH